MHLDLGHFGFGDIQVAGRLKRGVQPVAAGVEFVTDAFEQPFMPQPGQSGGDIIRAAMGCGKAVGALQRLFIGLKSSTHKKRRLDPGRRRKPGIVRLSHCSKLRLQTGRTRGGQAQNPAKGGGIKSE